MALQLSCWLTSSLYHLACFSLSLISVAGQRQVWSLWDVLRFPPSFQHVRVFSKSSLSSLISQVEKHGILQRVVPFLTSYTELKTQHAPFFCPLGRAEGLDLKSESVFLLCALQCQSTHCNLPKVAAIYAIKHVFNIPEPHCVCVFLARSLSHSLSGCISICVCVCV